MTSKFSMEKLKGLTYALILEGLVPSAPPTTDILLIFTSDVNLSPLKREGKKNKKSKKKSVKQILPSIFFCSSCTVKHSLPLCKAKVGNSFVLSKEC